MYVALLEFCATVQSVFRLSFSTTLTVQGNLKCKALRLPSSITARCQKLIMIFFIGLAVSLPESTTVTYIDTSLVLVSFFQMIIYAIWFMETILGSCCFSLWYEPNGQFLIWLIILDDKFVFDRFNAMMRYVSVDSLLSLYDVYKYWKNINLSLHSYIIISFYFIS